MKDQLNRFNLMLSLRGTRKTDLPMATRVGQGDPQSMVVDEFLATGEEMLLPMTIRKQGG